MHIVKLSLPGVLFSLFTPLAHAAEPYIGQFLYQYEGGNVYRVIVNVPNALSWECIKGAEKGAHGMETPERIKVDDNIYFATWREKTGINVTQVIDLKNMKVYSTIIDGKERYVLSGKIVREK